MYGDLPTRQIALAFSIAGGLLMISYYANDYSHIRKNERGISLFRCTKQDDCMKYRATLPSKVVLHGDAFDLSGDSGDTIHEDFVLDQLRGRVPGSDNALVKINEMNVKDVEVDQVALEAGNSVPAAKIIPKVQSEYERQWNEPTTSRGAPMKKDLFAKDKSDQTHLLCRPHPGGSLEGRWIYGLEVIISP